MSYTKQIAKAMSVFNKARSDLNRTITEISHEAQKKEALIATLNAEYDGLISDSLQAQNLRNKITDFLGDGEK